MTRNAPKERILAVDDSPDTLEVLRRNLTSHGYQVLTVQSVAEAVHVLEHDPIDVVVTDLKMPGASGLELVRHVRENLKNTEVLMITGYPTVEGAVEAVKSGANDYLALIRGAKQAVGVPVVASVNCAAGPWWTEFASQIESAGADALELNIGFVPLDGSESAEKIEERVVSIVRDVRAATRLPLAVKLGPDWTNLNHLAPRLVEAGARALVLFNRFYRLDLDLDAMKLKSGPTKAGSEDYHETLRWIGMLDGRLRDAELVAGNGVRDAETALRLVASGASAVQVCSLLYEKGYDAIGGLARAMSARLDALGLKDLKSLRGRLSRRMSEKPEAWGRAQYVQALTGIS